MLTKIIAYSVFLSRFCFGFFKQTYICNFLYQIQLICKLIKYLCYLQNQIVCKKFKINKNKTIA